eukprot:6576718-Prymnesium_polylepis.1
MHTHTCVSQSFGGRAYRPRVSRPSADCERAIASGSDIPFVVDGSELAPGMHRLWTTGFAVLGVRVPLQLARAL